MVGHICVGQGYNAAGDFKPATKSFEQGVAVAADPLYSQWAKTFLGPNYLLNNQIPEAEKAFKEVWDYTNTFGCEMIRPYAFAWLGVVSIIKGSLSKGIGMVEETKQGIIEGDRKGWLAFWEYILGNLYLQVVQGGENQVYHFW